MSNKGLFGGVPELADGLDLGSSAAMRGGSSPPFPTGDINRQNSYRFLFPPIRWHRQIVIQLFLASTMSPSFGDDFGITQIILPRPQLLNPENEVIQRQLTCFDSIEKPGQPVFQF